MTARHPASPDRPAAERDGNYGAPATTAATAPTGTVTALRSAGGVGSPVERPDARAKMAGDFPYATSLHAPGELHGVTVRSDTASADLLGVDTGDAMAVPGAVRVLTLADVPGARRIGLKAADQPVLADGRIRYHGEPIAFAVAETAEAARLMAGAVRPRLRPRPALLDPLAALLPDAPRLGPDGNLVHELRLRRGTARGPVAVRHRWHTGRQDAAFLAPEAGLAVPDTDGGVTLRVATQDLHADRAQIAAALALPPDLVRVELAGVGGAFGGREDITLHVHLCLAARLTGRPVRAVYSRPESLAAHPHRHPCVLDYELTAEPDGTFVSLSAELCFDGGPYASTSMPVTRIGHHFAAGPYRFAAVQITSRAVRTNNPVSGALRGFGATQACFGLESTIDLLARRLGTDPVPLRWRNLLAAGEPLAVSGQRLDGVAPPREVLDACLSVPMPHAPVAAGLRRGVGVAVGVKSAGLGDGRADPAGIVLRATREGVLVSSAAPEVGQGIGAVLAQIVREHLGDVPVRAAPVTSALPVSGASKASRQTMASGGAAHIAARQLRVRLLKLVADRGGEYPPGGGPLSVLAEGEEVVVEARNDGVPTRPADPVTGEGTPHPAFQLTAHRAVVDVDPVLGTARLVQLVTAQDVGRAVNRVLCAGQLAGGSVQGAGFALTEEIEVDAEGRSLTGGFGDYLLPAATDAAEIVPVLLEHPHPRLAFGAKGLGEGPLISSPAAVAAALRDATGRVIDRVPARLCDIAVRPQSPSGHGEEPYGHADAQTRHKEGDASDVRPRGASPRRADSRDGTGVWLRPATLAEALQMHADHPDALVLAGGTGLQPLLNSGALRPSRVLDLGSLTDGRMIRAVGDGHLLLGPAVTVAAAADGTLAPVLADVVTGFATPAVRRRATLVGNICHRRGPRDLAAVLLALDARLSTGLPDAGELGPALPFTGAPPAGLVTGLAVTLPHRFAYRRLAVREHTAPTLLALAVSELPDGTRVVCAGTAVAAPGPVTVPVPDGDYGDFASRVVRAVPLQAVPQADRAHLRAALAELSRRCHDALRAGGGR
ncbi:molybdopterin cofactor-binding domain-containing protein [Streptomyces shenzhenensis]|uniref:molybdopterin cofactor-binding domain-containing protein n=1 Tax=Streptomyces shenzhenensis TaxID=943815 RepID=UPI0037F6AFF8